MSSYVRHATNWILEIDPTLIQFRLSCRVLLSIICVSLSLIVLNQFLPLSEAAVAIALSTTLQGAVAVRDKTASARAVTRIYSGIAGFFVVCVITYFEHRPLAVGAVLLAVVFLAVYAPRYGDRWKAVGAFAFFCCILSGFLKPIDSELPGLAVSLAVSSIISHMVRNYILPERPADDFRRAARALDSLMREFKEQVRRCATSRHHRRDLQKLLGIKRRARNALIHAEEYLPLDADDKTAGLAGRLFDLDLTMDACVMAVIGKPSKPADMKSCLVPLDQIQLEIKQSVAEIPDSTFTTSAAKDKPVRKAAAEAQLRQAVQVTLASAIAMTLGLWLSQERWFWAVMTAFIVFMNTHSTEETWVRALNRTLGTAIGIVAGIALATILNGALVPSVLLTAIALAIGYFVMAISYTVFCIFLTIAISLIYGLVGSFTPHLLMLRLEETAIGAAAGIFVSLWALPIRTHDRLINVFRNYLQRIDTLLSLFCDPARNEVAITRQLRLIEGAHSDCLTALSPLRSAWRLGPEQSGSRNAVMRVNTLQYSVEGLARIFAATAPTPDQVERITELRREIKVLGTTKIDLLSPATSAPLEIASSTSVTETDIYLQRLALVLYQLDPNNQEA